jgi:hypothetical protein
MVHVGHSLLATRLVLERNSGLVVAPLATVEIAWITVVPETVTLEHASRWHFYDLGVRSNPEKCLVF